VIQIDGAHIGLMKKSTLNLIPLRTFIVFLCLPFLFLGNGMLTVNICETPVLPAWCKFCDTFFQVCSSFCFNKTFYVQFNSWQLDSPGLLYTSFPIDHEETNHIHVVKGALFSRSLPTPFFTTAQLAGLSEDVISDILDLELDDVRRNRLFTEFVCGKIIRSLESPLSHRYGGYQFGIWAGQLGDGRVHLIGEYVSQHEGSRWELQLKGSGKTPYSRDGDGRAVLRSSVREFLASEATYHLGELYRVRSAHRSLIGS